MAVVVNDRVRGQWMKLVSQRLLAPPPRWKFIHRAHVSIFRMNREHVDLSGMSGSEKSIRPIRQLSLQPSAPRRQQIRRQRSAEDDKSLQICASPLARGKRGTSGKTGSERPKVRVAWKENRRKNEKNEELGQVEVVARQIPGRSRSTTGRSRGFVGTEKPTILYSRLELAERLRLAWEYRERNKANINIFLARQTVDERCESEMSNHTNASSPVRKEDEPKIEISPDDYKAQNEKEEKKIIDKSISIEGLLENDNSTTSRRCDEKFLHPSTDNKQVLGENEVSVDTRKADLETGHSNEQISKDANIDDTNTKEKSSASIDCSSYRVTATALPSIKIENSTLGVMKVSKEDFSSAKQKRASFHSGTNRAFLDPIRSSTEFRWDSTSDKNVPQKSAINNRATVERSPLIRTTVENKENVTNERAVPEENVPEFRSDLTGEKGTMEGIVTDGKLSCVTEENERMKTVIETKNAAAEDDETTTRKTNETDEFNLIGETLPSSIEDKDSSTIDKARFSKNSSEVRCSSVNERDPPLKKTTENQKIDQKSRRTSSAPPQRRFESTLASNRVHVNIVIDSSGKNKNQGKQDADCKDNAMEKVDITSTKMPSNRAVRSAPLKRRSRSARRRFWGGGSSKNDEDGKSANRSAGRAKNSIDSRTMDIVTMVSLVSSTDSDSDTENSLRDDKLIDELRSKLPTTSIIKTSINHSALSNTRKPIKSVSFQKDSFDENAPSKEQQPLSREEKKTAQPWLAIVNQRGNGTTSSSEETVSWRTDITNSSALPILALIHDVEEPLDVPLTDREKRCLAVPIGDLHDRKRKLLKTRSTPSRSGMDKQTTSLKIKTQDSPRRISEKMEVPAQQIKTLINNSPANIKSKETFQHVQSTSTEPHFRSSKEKECWHLYKKMCDKGVCVSFDTVLRGMLTPTEYRLRQREVSQNLQ